MLGVGLKRLLFGSRSYKSCWGLGRDGLVGALPRAILEGIKGIATQDMSSESCNKVKDFLSTQEHEFLEKKGCGSTAGQYKDLKCYVINEADKQFKSKELTIPEFSCIYLSQAIAKDRLFSGTKPRQVPLRIKLLGKVARLAFDKKFTDKNHSIRLTIKTFNDQLKTSERKSNALYYRFNMKDYFKDLEKFIKDSLKLSASDELQLRQALNECHKYRKAIEKMRIFRAHDCWYDPKPIELKIRKFADNWIHAETQGEYLAKQDPVRLSVPKDLLVRRVINR